MTVPVTVLPKVLLVDDESMSLQALRRVLEDDFQLLLADSTAKAEQMLSDNSVQVIVCDQKMPDMSGGEFLALVRVRWPDVVRIAISAFTDPKNLIQCINEGGVYQFIPKPWLPEHLVYSLQNAAELYRLQKENALLNLELRRSLPAMSIQNRSLNQTLIQHHKIDNRKIENLSFADGSPMELICQQVMHVAGYDIPVLVTGESGTGKELITRALHYNSPRAEKPFVMENCGALPVQLLESELFGHARGAFTGATSDKIGLLEQADGGSVFLDEIGETSQEFQIKLLRFLQEGEFRPLGSNRLRKVNVRVISATNRDLEEEVKQGRFREDLFYRLAVMPIHIPPLRARAGDIPSIANTLLDSANRSYGTEVKKITAETLACMARYPWPGNVREMENEIRRMVVMAEGETLSAELLSDKVLHNQNNEEDEAELSSAECLHLSEGSLKEQVEKIEARILRATLIRNKWNKSRAALELGLSRVGLRAKLERYGLTKATDAG